MGTAIEWVHDKMKEKNKDWLFCPFCGKTLRNTNGFQ